MIKKLRVTVDGVSYDVIVELPEEGSAGGTPSTSSVPPVISSAPASNQTPRPVTPTPAPLPVTPPPSVQASGPGDVPSPLAGRVTAVVVVAGQDVKEGEHLLTLEAMKMNTFVFAPKSGKVADLKVA